MAKAIQGLAKAIQGLAKAIQGLAKAVQGFAVRAWRRVRAVLALERLWPDQNPRLEIRLWK